jgi:hypothetical protein
MNREEQLTKFREQLIQAIRETVEKENGCIGTYYKNKGCHHVSYKLELEYDDSPIIVVAYNPDINTYGHFEAATVYDLYISNNSCLICTLNGETGEDWEEPVENLMTDSLLNIVEWMGKNSLINKQPDNPYRCEECGSTNLQKMAWVYPNKNNEFDAYCGDDADNGEHWCDDCEEHVGVLPEDKLLKDIEKWWNELAISEKEEITGLRLYDFKANKAGHKEFVKDTDSIWNEFFMEDKIEKWKSNKEE